MVEEHLHNNSQTEEKQLFISWSGVIGKKIANIIYDWIDRCYKNANSNVFLSTRIEPGRQGFC